MGKGQDTVGPFLERAASAGATHVELRSKDGPIETWELGEAEELVGAILFAAENDAGGIAARYQVVARTGDRDWGRVALTVGGDKEGADLATRGAAAPMATDISISSIVNELIRDRRESQRMNHLYADRIMSRMSQFADTQAVIAANAEKRHIESLELMERLLADKEERDVRIQARAAEAVRSQRAFDEFIPVAKVGLNRLLGAASGNPTIVADEAIESLLGSIGGDKAGKILEILSPTEQAAFFEIYNAYAERAAKKAKAAEVANAKAANGIVPPAETSGTK